MRVAIEIGIRAIKAYGADGCAVFAGGITYYALLSLFPLTLLVISVAGFVFQDEDDQQRLIDNMLDTLPIDQTTGRDDLESLVDSVVSARGTLGVIALATAAYSSSALFGAVRTALNAVVKAERRRPFFLGKAVDLLQVAILTLLLLLSVAVTVGITLAQRFSSELFGEAAASWISRLLTLGYAVLPTAVSAVAFFLVYTLVPARRLGLRDTLHGAAVAAVLFEILKVLFAQYVANFGNYNATYGTLGFVVVLLVFFNFSAQVLLLGAEVARSSTEVRAGGIGHLSETDALGARLRKLLRRLPLAPAAPPAPADEPGPDSRPPRSVQTPAQPGQRRPGLAGLLLFAAGVALAWRARLRR